MFQRKTEDFNIGPISTRKRPNNPDDVACHNANGDFIPETWSTKFVGISGLATACGPVNPEVRAINCDEAILADATELPVFPNNLNVHVVG